ncbi:D(2) dopamine receptor A-like [Actinia tenebrosa]|uniref:D(2) dopamine receptor A-like n=1 Tax=Actinia tenebrosa TaxID=6105 RepID=A0A6P8J037_ACTTE|nr:D(2) dopamine receptor A-like [Actinia tenebrosa]
MFNSSSNGSDSLRGKENFIEYPWLLVWSSLYAFIAFASFTGNVLIITVFYKKRKLRTRTNYFVIGLAAADVLVGLVTIPLWVAYFNLLYNKTFEQAMTVKQIFSPMDIFSGMLSILHLMTISLERLYAIALPLRHRTSRTIYNIMILAIIWVSGGLVAASYFFLPQGIKWKGTFMIYSALGFFIPFSIICVAYLSIMVIVKKQTKSVTRSRAKIVKRESKTAITVFTLVLLFLITWLPFFSLNMVLFACQKCALSVTFNLVSFCKALHYMGSALNPVVYSARMPEFRRPIAMLLRQRRFSQSFSRRSSKRSFTGGHFSQGSRGDYELSDFSGIKDILTERA